MREGMPFHCHGYLTGWVSANHTTLPDAAAADSPGVGWCDALTESTIWGIHNFALVTMVVLAGCAVAAAEPRGPGTAGTWTLGDPGGQDE